MADLVQIAELDWRNGLLFLGAMMVLAIFILQKGEWILEKFGITTKRQLKEEQQEKDIEQLKDFADSDKHALGKLQEHAERSDKNMEEVKNHVRQTDKSIDRLVACMESMKETVDGIAYKVQDLQMHQDDILEYRKAREEREHKRDEDDAIRAELTLGMARVMLLDNYVKCVEQGYYDLNQRSVYHTLYEAYVGAGGNSVIVSLAKRIVELPIEPPTHGNPEA